MSLSAGRGGPGQLPQGFAFETEVRRVAEAVWGLEPGQCQPKSYSGIPGLTEVDAVVALRDVTHVLMATLDPKFEKTKADVQKLQLAERQESKRGVPVKKWLITRQQLDALHVTFARTHNVEALTLAQFRSRYFDASGYLQLRRSAPFGSARDPATLSVTIAEDEYIEPVMTAVLTEPGRRDSPEQLSDLDTIASWIRAGRYVVLLGQFGVGKSLTTRELFMRLAGEYYQQREATTHVPVAVNLRESWGLRAGREILERHGRELSFRPSEDLVSAWRSGMLHLLLDGFDEVASQAIASSTDRHFMRNARSEALTGLRDLVRNLPQGSGLLVCGRDHYFDDLPELIDGLGLNGRAFAIVKLGDFSEDQVETYLQRHGAQGYLPDWLPRKPLLLGYLATRGLLDEILGIDASQGFGHAWSQFLDLICYREAEHEASTMNGATIRRVLERLAAIARTSASGNGPITGPDLAEAYLAETGSAPGEGVLMQLQRLPGLTPREQDATSRSFVDIDLLAALQGSVTARCIVENSSDLAERRWVSGLAPTGVQMAAHLLRQAGYNHDVVIGTALRWATRATERPWEGQLAADALLVAIELAGDAPIDAQGLELREGQIDALEIEDTPLRNLAISDSTIGHLAIGEPASLATLRFRDCLIGRVSGASGPEALPAGSFVACEVGEYDDASTNAAVIRLDLPPQIRVLMTILRKLFIQAGRGRKLAALRRGLPEDLVPHVDQCIDVLRVAGIIEIHAGVAHPVRKHDARVRKMIGAAINSDDVVVRRLLQT